MSLRFGGLNLREVRVPAGMTVRFERDALIVEAQPDLQELRYAAQKPQWDALHRQADADVAAGVLAEMDEVERLQAERDAARAALAWAMRQPFEYPVIIPAEHETAIDAARGAP